MAQIGCASPIDERTSNAAIPRFILKTSNAQRRTSNSECAREHALNDSEFDVESWALSVERFRVND